MFSDVLLTVDYDRTLTGPDSTIPQKNIEAIAYFIANGGTFTVNTGRCVPACACFQDKVPMNAPILAYNGAAWYDPKTGEVSNVTAIDADREEMITAIEEQFPDLTVEVQGIAASFGHRKSPQWEAYLDNIGVRWAYKDLTEIREPFLKFAVYGKFLSTEVSSLYQATEEEMAYYDTVVDFVMQRWGEKVDFFRACARLIDFQAKGISKITSARRLQEKLGKKILVCVGDAENDTAMLDGADYAFCPADGVVADRYENVCNCGDGAVADVIYKKIPEIIGFFLDRTK